MKTFICAVSACICLWTNAAFAAVIGFDAFNNYRQPAFRGISEDGFSVTVTEGAWKEAFFFGSGAPSIFSRSDQAAISVQADDLSAFKARSVDIGNGAMFSGAVDYYVAGSFGSASIFERRGRVSDLQSFNTVLLDPTQVIDRLVISFTNDGAASYNIDNISLTAGAGPVVMPLPASLGFLLVAGATLIGLRRLT